MRPEDVLFWLRAQPFRPIGIMMVGGRTYEIRHPEFVRLLRTSLIVFTPSDVDDVFDRAEMLSLVLVQTIEPGESAALTA
jgi:hypothetical protein